MFQVPPSLIEYTSGKQNEWDVMCMCFRMIIFSSFYCESSLQMMMHVFHTYLSCFLSLQLLLFMRAILPNQKFKGACALGAWSLFVCAAAYRLHFNKPGSTMADVQLLKDTSPKMTTRVAKTIMLLVICQAPQPIADIGPLNGRHRAFGLFLIWPCGSAWWTHLHESIVLPSSFDDCTSWLCHILFMIHFWQVNTCKNIESCRR